MYDELVLMNVYIHIVAVGLHYNFGLQATRGGTKHVARVQKSYNANVAGKILACGNLETIVE